MGKYTSEVQDLRETVEKAFMEIDRCSVRKVSLSFFLTVYALITKYWFSFLTLFVINYYVPYNQI